MAGGGPRGCGEAWGREAGPGEEAGALQDKARTGSFPGGKARERLGGATGSPSRRSVSFRSLELIFASPEFVAFFFLEVRWRRSESICSASRRVPQAWGSGRASKRGRSIGAHGRGGEGSILPSDPAPSGSAPPLAGQFSPDTAMDPRMNQVRITPPRNVGTSVENSGCSFGHVQVQSPLEV